MSDVFNGLTLIKMFMSGYYGLHIISYKERLQSIPIGRVFIKAVSRMFPFSCIRKERVVEELPNASIERIQHYDLPPTIVPRTLPFSFHPLKGEFLALDLN